MERWQDFKKELLKDPEVAGEYQKLAPRYELISELIKLRIKNGLTQKELAEKIGTKQSAVSRLESGNGNPSLKCLEKIFLALGAQLHISAK